MSLDLLDLYEMREIGDRNNIRVRAQMIQDNFGIKPMELTDFRRQHGGYGIGKALLWAVGIGLAVGLIASLALPAAAGALIFGLTPVVFLGVSAGMTAAEFSLLHTNRQVMRAYGSYLDEEAAQGREARDKGISSSRNVDYDDGTERSTSHAADLAARQQAEQADRQR